MTNLRPQTAALALTFVLAAGACSGKLLTRASDGGDGGGDANPPSSSSGGSGSSVSGSSGSSGAGSPPGVSGSLLHNQSVDKIDLLFMIDNSAAMGDKHALLAQAVPDLITRLVTPNCVDGAGNVVGRANMMGACAAGRAEFPPVHDMHIAIVTSSLGGRGGNECSAADQNPANMALNAHEDDKGHLINRGGVDEHLVAKAGNANQNFLAWFPPVAANAGRSMPSPAETVVGAPGAADTLVGDFTDMISGVHEHGCGFEAQNEAWYRFLIQPDPFDSIQLNGSKASLNGVDQLILQQRAAFLRPDSLLAIIVVTDENEEVANPLSIGGQGWLYENFPWPNSPSGGAPEGTAECNQNPNDPNCTSCAFQSVVNSPNFASRCPPDLPNGTGGYLDSTNDQVNVRFFDQKRRFGVFAGYPVTRYTRGLMQFTVPDRAHEVDGNGNYVGDQDMYANCVNPIYAQNLPTSGSGAALCNLARGPRSPDLVFYAAIAGVPHQLLQAQPGDPECPAGTAPKDCPQKETFADIDWRTMTGTDPEHYDFSNADFHMLESIGPRSQSNCGVGATDTCDLINGREWNTNKNDLEFACIFPLVNPATGAIQPKDCTSPAYTQACACAMGSNSQNTPLCQKMGQTYTTQQIASKTYPSIREIEIAHAMATSPNGDQGIVSSLCPIHTSFAGGDMNDPLFGYRPAVNAIVNGLKNALSVQCLPQKLTVTADGTVPCRILVSMPPDPALESFCATLPGLAVPPPDLLQRFRASTEAQWNAAGGSKSGLPDPATQPVCELTQIGANDSQYTNCATGNPTTGQSSPGSNTPNGWCYVSGASSSGHCAQQILFTANEPPRDGTLTLVCMP